MLRSGRPRAVYQVVILACQNVMVDFISVKIPDLTTLLLL